MAKFIIRRSLLLLLTMFLVSVAVFLITESSPGNVARNVLGSFVTPEQEASFLDQTGLDEAVWLRYLSWLVGSDWHAESRSGLTLKRLKTDQGYREWWAETDAGQLVRWKLEGDDLIAIYLHPDGTFEEKPDNGRWRTDGNRTFFWGIDARNHAVHWEKGSDRKVWTFVMGTGWMESTGGPVDYIPLK
jgi:peptide/nickel transport system permease protein